MIGIESNEHDESAEHEVVWSREKPVHYLSEFEVAVCVMCGYGLNARPVIRRHLISRYPYSWREAKGIEDEFQGLTIRCHY